MLYSCSGSKMGHRSMGLQIKMHLKHFPWHSQNMQKASSKINSQNGIKTLMSPRQTCVASNQTVSYNHLSSSLVTWIKHRRNIIPSSCLPPLPLLPFSSYVYPLPCVHLATTPWSNTQRWPDFRNALIRFIEREVIEIGGGKMNSTRGCWVESGMWCLLLLVQKSERLQHSERWCAWPTCLLHCTIQFKFNLLFCRARGWQSIALDCCGNTCTRVHCFPVCWCNSDCLFLLSLCWSMTVSNGKVGNLLDWTYIN